MRSQLVRRRATAQAHYADELLGQQMRFHVRRPDALRVERLGAVVAVVHLVRIGQRQVQIEILLPDERLQAYAAPEVVDHQNVFDVVFVVTVEE